MALTIIGIIGIMVGLIGLVVIIKNWNSQRISIGRIRQWLSVAYALSIILVMIILLATGVKSYAVMYCLPAYIINLAIIIIDRNKKNAFPQDQIIITKRMHPLDDPCNEDNSDPKPGDDL